MVLDLSIPDPCCLSYFKLSDDYFYIPLHDDASFVDHFCYSCFTVVFLY